MEHDPDLTKVDLHSHTYYSLLRIPRIRSERFFQDSAISPKVLIKIARRKKIGALALTDHDNSNGIRPFLKYASKFSDFTPIVGQEVTKYDQKQRAWAHVLVYGMKQIPWKIRFQPLPEFLEHLDDNNAVYVLAHPFDLSQSAPAGGYNRKTWNINFAILKRFGMIETVNGLQPKRHNYLAQIIAREMGLPGTAGGDSHQPKMIGRCYTYLEGTEEAEILEYLRKVKRSPANYSIQTHGSGSNSQIWAEWFFYLLHHLEYNLRYDIYHHLNPSGTQDYTRNPVYEKLYASGKFMLLKVLARAAIPYIFWALLAGVKIWVPHVEKQTREKEAKVLRSLVDQQAENENGRTLDIDLTASEEEKLLWQLI